MTPAVRLERFKPLEKSNRVDGTAEGRRGVTRSDNADPESTAKLPGAVKKTKSRPLKVLGTSVKGIDPTEAVPPSKMKRQRSNPPSSDALSTKFGSALHPRGQAEWDQLCSATDVETGQLRGNVGTPDDPLFTYEEAVRQRGTGQDLLLYVGPDIIPTGDDEFPKKEP